MSNSETSHIIKEVLDGALSEFHERARVGRLRDGVGGLRGNLAQWFDGDADLCGVREHLVEAERVGVLFRGIILQFGNFVNVGRLGIRQETQQLPDRGSVWVWPAKVN